MSEYDLDPHEKAEGFYRTLVEQYEENPDFEHKPRVVHFWIPGVHDGPEDQTLIQELESEEDWKETFHEYLEDGRRSFVYMVENEQDDFGENSNYGEMVYSIEKKNGSFSESIVLRSRFDFMSKPDDPDYISVTEELL